MKSKFIDIEIIEPDLSNNHSKLALTSSIWIGRDPNPKVTQVEIDRIIELGAGIYIGYGFENNARFFLLAYEAN